MPIDETQLIRVATSGDYPPFSLASESGYFGFDIELTQLIAVELGLGIEFKSFAWTEFDALLQACALAQPAFDMVASGVTVTEERRRYGVYSRPYLRMKSVIIGPKFGSKILMSPMTKLGVNRGGYLERLARQRLGDHVIVTTSNNRKLPTMIPDQADCLLTDSLEAAAIIRHYDFNVWQELEVQEIGLLLPKSKLQLLAEVDAIIATLFCKGRMSALAKRHHIPLDLLPPGQ